MNLDELIDYLGKCETKDGEFYLFNYLVSNSISKEEEKYILNSLSFRKRFFYKRAINYLKTINCSKAFNQSVEIEKDFSASYNHFIKQFNLLCDEMGCSNSLDISILFYIFLNAGLFSINGNHIYDTNDCLNIRGHYYVDIFHGHGVCINYSDMLKDILKSRGYDVINMLCYSDSFDSILFKPNHLVNLVIEENHPYIFDTTNLGIYNCINNKNALLIEGDGSFSLKLYPYLSSCFFGYDKDIFDRVKTFSLMRDYSSLYSKDDFDLALGKCKESVGSNSSLIKYFRKDIEGDIFDIVSKTKVKEIRK